MEVVVFHWVRSRLERLGSAASLSTAHSALPAGAYTTFRTHGGHRVVRLDDHVERLNDSATPAPGNPRLGEDDLRAAVAAALGATGHAESRVRVTYAPPELFVSVEPFHPLPETLYQEGVWCVTTPLRRQNPHAKDTSFIDVATEAYRTLPPGAHEALMVAEDGTLLEGLSSNLFAVLDGALYTEDARVLPGLTRRLVLEAAEDLLPRAGRAVRLDELPRVSECFLTSASREVLPVVRIDDVGIGNGRPGPIAPALLRRYREAVGREARSVFSDG